MRTETKQPAAIASDGREKYMAPAIEVIDIEVEGSVMTASDFGNGGSATRSFGKANTYSGSYSTNVSSNDLEDLIDEILTVEQ